MKINLKPKKEVLYMKYLKNNFIIPQSIKRNWQNTIDLVFEMMDVTAVFINRIDKPNLEVLKISKREDVSIKEGDIVSLADVFCQETINRGEMVEIKDATSIEKWEDSAELDMGFVSYLGFPIYFPEKDKIFGTICVVDTKPQEFTETEKDLMEKFRNYLENQLENIRLNYELEDQVELTQSSLDSLSAHIAVLDKEGVIRYTNQAWKEFARKNGLDPSRAGQGINYLDIIKKAKGINSDSSDQAFRGIKSVIQGETELFTLEYPCHSPNEKRWFMMRVTPFQGQGSYAAVVAHENITERKKTEDKLKKSQKMADLGSWELDLTENKLFWSEEIYRIFGWNPQNFDGTYEDFLRGVHPEDRAKVDEAYKSSIAQNKDGYEIEHRIVRKDNGEVRYVKEKCEHMRNDEGKVVRSLGMVQDITARKKREKELEKQNQQIKNLNEKLNENLEGAKALHQQFLPEHLPKIKNLSFGTYYQAANKLGGDFYDIIELEDNLLFYVSDVSGHDLKSSMVNIFLKETINSYLLHYQNENDYLYPSRILNYINERFKNENFPADLFITLVIGVIDLNNFKVSLSNAGFQFPALVTQKDGSISSLFCKGFPVTVIKKDFNYEECSYSLNPGDIIHINTDGLIEQSNKKGDRFSEDRLLRILTQNADLHPDQILEKVYHELYEFKGDLPIQDDLTSLLVQRNFS